MAYGDLKDLPRRTASDKMLPDKSFDITKNPTYHGYQRGLASIVYKFSNKKSALLTDKSTVGGAAKSKIMPNQQLAEELHKIIIRKLGKRKVHSSFIDNIWVVDFADMQLISKFDKRISIFIICY